MKNFPLRVLSLIAVTIVVGQGCSTARAPGGSVPVEDQSSTAAGVPDTYVGPQTGTRSRTESSAVVDLLASAQLDMEGGKPESAAATLERALRLEPRDALLWYRLALIRLRQGEWQQVLSLAQKSNSLAAGDRNLQLQNWYLIATAYARLKDNKGVAHARAVIRQLEEQLGVRGEG